MFTVVIDDNRIVSVAPGRATVRTNHSVASVANKREYMRRFGRMDGADSAWSLAVTPLDFSAFISAAEGATSVAEVVKVFTGFVAAVQEQLEQLD